MAKEKNVFLDLLLIGILWGLDLLVSWHGHAAPAWLDARWVPLLSAIGYLPLPWRRRFPTVVLVLTVGGSLFVSILVPDLVITFNVWLALYSTAAHCTRGRAIAGLVLSLLPVGQNALLEARIAPVGSGLASLSISALIGTMISTASFAVGRWVRWSVEQRNRVAQLTASKAVSDERGRIARDLHDIVAHAVSLMVLQAGGAEKLLESNPDRARVALQHVDALGQQAIIELQRMLGILDTDTSEAPNLHGLADLDDLTEDFRSTGLNIVCNHSGITSPLEPGVSMSAYRIVQEALTNASKYADRSLPVEVMVASYEDHVSVKIASRQGTHLKHRTAALTTGHGILGMKERAKAAGGTLTAGPTPDGGFAVTAVFPVSGSTPSSAEVTVTKQRFTPFRRTGPTHAG